MSEVFAIKVYDATTSWEHASIWGFNGSMQRIWEIELPDLAGPIDGWPDSPSGTEFVECQVLGSHGGLFFGSFQHSYDDWNRTDTWTFAFNQSGDIVWVEPGYWNSWTDFDQRWAEAHYFHDGILYVSYETDGLDPDLFAHDAVTGDIIWSTSISETSNPSRISVGYEQDHLICSVGSSGVRKLDISTGVIEESGTLPVSIQFDALRSVGGNYVVGTSSNNTVSAYDHSNLGLSWSVSDFRGTGLLVPYEDDGRIFAIGQDWTGGSNQGNVLKRIAGHTGSVTWTAVAPVTTIDGYDGDRLLLSSTTQLRGFLSENGGELWSVTRDRDRIAEIKETFIIESDDQWWTIGHDGVITDLTPIGTSWIWSNYQGFTPNVSPNTIAAMVIGIPSLRLNQRDDSNEFGSSRIERVQVSSAQKSGRIPGPNAYW